MVSENGESGVVGVVAAAVVVKSEVRLMHAPGEVTGTHRYCARCYLDVTLATKACPACGYKEFTEEAIEVGMPVNLTKEMVTEHPSPLHGNYDCPILKQLGVV